MFLRSFSLTSLADLPRIKSENADGQLSTDDLTDGEEYNDIDS